MESPKINQSKSSYQRRYDDRNERLFDAIIIAIVAFTIGCFLISLAQKDNDIPDKENRIESVRAGAK